MHPPVEDLEILHRLDAEHLPGLMRLFSQAWWTRDRTEDGVRRMLAADQVVVAAVRRDSGELLGFARALTDWTYLAHVLDVVVAEELRGRGVGSLLMTALVEHPRLRDVKSIELVCQGALEPYYQRWGFTAKVGGSRLMRRTEDPRFAPPAEPARA